MADRLHMTQTTFDLPQLLGVRERHGLPVRGRESVGDDLGYLVHCQLQALFGERAPKPFLPRVQGRYVDVLGYSAADAGDLEAAAGLAEPVWGEPKRIASRAMPTLWPSDRRYRFEVRACPVVRGNWIVDGETKRWERDAYQRAWDLAEDGKAEKPGSREEIYRDWLLSALETSGARLVDTPRLEAFRLARLLRRRHGPQRTPKLVTRPDATLSGRLEVVDSDAFTRWLARGIGRHKAFGFGMVLLRPA